MLSCGLGYSPWPPWPTWRKRRAGLLFGGPQDDRLDRIAPTPQFSHGYGADVTILTLNDIAALITGLPIWFSDGEYSHILITEAAWEGLKGLSTESGLGE